MTPLSDNQKYYCYVDETSQDTLGEFFVVSVVVSGAEKGTLAAALERIEITSGKGKVKWMKVRRRPRLAYIKDVLASPAFQGTLYFSLYKGTKS